VHERIDPTQSSTQFVNVTVMVCRHSHRSLNAGRKSSATRSPLTSIAMPTVVEPSDRWRSLLVMNSLLEKEGMAGQVQMVYIDPPYGIKYGSNFSRS